MKRFIALKVLGIILIPLVFIIWQVLKAYPDWVEQYYSLGFYPVLIKNISAISSVFNFALHELVVIAFVLIVLFLVVLDFKLNATLKTKLLGAVLSIVSISGWLYFLLVFMWGINHLRNPIEETFELTEALTDTQQSQVLDYVISEVNIAAQTMQVNKEGVTLDQCADVTEVFELLDKQINQASINFLKAYNFKPIKAAEGRYLIFSDFMRSMGVAGVYNPIVAQPAISKSLPPLLQSQVLAHEYGHLNGFADEAAADFIGYVSLLSSSSKQLRYEALLSLIWQTGERNNEKLSLAVKADLNCIYLNVMEFKKKNKDSVVDNVVKPVVKAANDQYLKSAGHEEGVKRYSIGEQLVLRYLYKKLKKQP